MNDTKSIEKMTFEEALAELTDLVKDLDADNVNLSEAINSFERGMELKTYCEAKLKDAKLKVEKIVEFSDGGVTTAPLEE